MNSTAFFLAARWRTLILRTFGFIVISLALAACSRQQFTGTYTSGGEERYRVTIEFRSGDSAIYTVMQNRMEATYAIDEKYLKLRVGNDSFIWDINEDGSLSSKQGLTLRKVKD